MPFVKLDCGMLRSTIWFDRDAREVFITALLMAEPREITEETPQIALDSLENTGWKVPPGWYGFVPAASVGIVHAAQVKQDDGMAALARLGAPEADSRSRDFEGRRLVRVDGGFLVLNFMRYRDRDYTMAARARRYRERKAASRRDAVSSHRDITQSEIRDQKQKQKKREKKADVIAPPARVSPTVFCRNAFVSSWEAQYGEKYPFAPNDGVQLAALLKENPGIGETWLGAVSRFLADPWHGENGRHGLAALCRNVVRYSGPARAPQSKADKNVSVLGGWLAKQEATK